MRTTLRCSLAALALALATPALASFGSGPATPTTPAPTTAQPAREDGTAGPSARQEAERWYHDAFEDIRKAKADLEGGKDKSAEKRFRRAQERGEKAVALDSTYHEAWNLVGYAARKLKDYDRAVASYRRCLALKPGYAPAREYLGEAYVEMGKLELAREQLASLERLEASDEARTLRAAIEAWEKAHPGGAAGAEGATAR